MQQRQLAILILGLAALAQAAAAAAQQVPRPPRVVAFVVGVERYAEPRLNQLSYVGEDAYRVWNNLKAIADFDESRSRIMVADRDPKGALPPEAGGMLTREQITTELERFLGRTRTGDTAILYFGGHGKVGFEDYGVSFLASNFADEGFVNAIFMRRVIEDARARTAAKSVPIVVLANMCHAGAPGVYDPDQTPSAREMADAGEKDAPATSKPVAYIPAAGGQTTYESDSLGGSLFVYHLDSALKGAAADEYGRVTTGKLLGKLQEAIPGIPLIGAFDGSIVMGRTGRQQAAYRRTLGIALLSAALDQADNAQLLQLAEHQFARAADLWQATRPANLLSVAEVQLLLGRESDAMPTLERAQQEAAANGDADVTKRIAAVRDPATAPSTARLSVLLLDGEARSRGTNAQLDAGKWLDLFKEMPQHRQSLRIEVPFPPPPGPDGFLAQAEKAVGDWRKTAGSDDTLVLVYSGAAGLSTDRGGAPSSGDELMPVSGADLWTLARLWEGPVVVVFDAPFGGVLKRGIPPELLPRTSLWLSAGQENGMAFAGSAPGQSTTALMVEATRQGLSEQRVQALAEQHRKMAGDLGEPEFQVGVPEWVGPMRPPFWTTTRVASARRELLKWFWWSDSVASRGAVDAAGDTLSAAALESLDSARRAAEAGHWRDAARVLATHADVPAVALRVAALHEAQGEHESARRHYERYVSASGADAAPPAAAAPDAAAVVDAARARKRTFVERIRARMPSLKPTRARVHFVGVAVQEYASPEVGDLALPTRDIQMWEDALRTGFGDRVVFHPVLRDRSAGDIRAALETVAAQSGEHELVVLVYSGRGLEQEEQKYLTGADSRPARQAQLEVVTSSWDATRLIAVSDVARTFAKRDLVMIMDAQFSTPRRGVVSALHKHLASLQEGEAGVGIDDSGPTRHHPAPAELRRHLYVWWEGELGEPTLEETDAEGAAASPLTRALVEALPGRETYADWLERASRALRADERRAGDAFGRLAVQGPESRPLMSAGASLEEALYLALQVDRMEANAELGSAWAEAHATVWTLHADRLARAALLVTLGRIRRVQNAPADATFESAIVLLDSMRREADALAKEGLLTNYVHWYTAALDEGLQDPDRALGTVLDVVGDDGDRQIAPELIDRLLQLTERAASMTATEKLRRSRDLLRGLPRARDDPRLERAIARLEALLREQLRASRGSGISIQ